MQDRRPVTFRDYSGSGFDVAEPAALEITAHFAEPIRWHYIAQKLAQRQTRAATTRIRIRSTLTSLQSRILTTASLLLGPVLVLLGAAWLRLPPRLRIRAYLALASAGRHLYGRSSSFYVQRLPFGLYLKTRRLRNAPALRNERRALELAAAHTDDTCVVPRPLDLVADAADAYLLTTRVPGHVLGYRIDEMDDTQLTAVVEDLRRFFRQLRAIPRTAAAAADRYRDWDRDSKEEGEYAITDSLGGACHDARINAAMPYDEARGGFAGPFATEEEFHEALRAYHLPGVVHRSGRHGERDGGGGGGIVFSHGDLNLRNVLVREDYDYEEGRNGPGAGVRVRVSGVVDWEMAGWYPAYWDLAKAHYATRLKWRWLRAVDDVFAAFGDYAEDLAIERKLWNYCF